MPITKPCNVLSMFLSFEPLKPYVLIWFVLVKKRVLDKHAPLKMKKLRGNQATFMTKELRKAIMDRSRFKNKYLKWPTRENFLVYKKAKNATL